MSKVSRTAVIIGLVLALCVAGTATAAKLITGKEIKDGSIGLVDLSRAAKRGLAGKPGANGKDGAAGPAGPAGAPGAAGPQGPAGPQSLTTTIRSAGVTVNANTIGRFELRCPDGMVALGGGVSPGANYVVLDGPSTDGKGWVGALQNVEATATRGAIEVICTVGAATRSTATGIVPAGLKVELTSEARAKR